tara:strand:+ start:141 stop:1199 length:1059 start_codon:yes stop_codon:yes gene_type:complete
MIEQVNKFFKKIFPNDETVVFAFLIFAALIIFSIFSSILPPFIISIVTAYLLVGLQKKIQSFGLGLQLSSITTFTIFIIVSTALLFWLMPILYNQLQSFVVDMPRLINEFINFVATIPAAYPELVSSDQISLFFQAVSSELTSITQNIVKTSISGIQSTITFLIYVILFPILVYFFFFDRKNITNGFVKIIPGKRDMLLKVWEEMDVQLSNYVRGKSLEIVIVGFSAAIIFVSLGLKYSALLSVLVGLSVIIPYIGAFLVTIPVVLVGLLQFGTTFDFWLLIILYLLLQGLDGNLLVPIIFSDAVKLHPVAIIVAVFVFGSMFGFWGVFFAIPIATFIKAVWNAWPSYQDQQ